MDHWDMDASATISASRWFRYCNGVLIYLYCSTSKSNCFWPTCHRLPLFRKNSSLAWEVIRKYVHRWTRIMKPLDTLTHESWNHLTDWFMPSLTFSTKCRNHHGIKKKRKKWRSWLTTISSPYSVQSLSNFNVTCFAEWVRQWIFFR